MRYQQTFPLSFYQNALMLLYAASQSCARTDATYPAHAADSLCAGKPAKEKMAHFASLSKCVILFAAAMATGAANCNLRLLLTLKIL